MIQRKQLKASFSMSIPIILDKSTFQGLNYNDIIEMHRYYDVNITPLLVSEILGDLSKEEKEGRMKPKEEVVNLAKKMFPYNSHVNMHYMRIIENSLVGKKDSTGNRPFLMADKSISGTKKGLYFVETEEEKSIKRWKLGNFSNLEEIISSHWRLETNNNERIKEFKEHFEYLSDIKVENNKVDNKKKFESLKIKFLQRIIDDLKPEYVLKNIIEFYNLDAEIASLIFYRWESDGFKTLMDFSKYAIYCYTIASMYYIGLNNHLFGERITNLLDLEYLYYAPFAKVFSTNDNFLTRLYDVIKPENMSFISLRLLKSDLRKFQKLNNSEKWSNYPPDKDTETYKIWDEIYDLELSNKRKPNKEEIESAKREMDEIIKMAESGEEGSFEGEPEFIVKKSYMSLNDPCVCGSGKNLGECCYKKE